MKPDCCTIIHGTAKTCHERLECKVDGAGEIGVYMEYARISSTTRRSNRDAQQVFRGALQYNENTVHIPPSRVTLLQTHPTHDRLFISHLK